ncbi:MAG: hypothetical protein KBF73_07205 [Flavobacteriales bacterium]|nr:hypothetical protein [Flavobacteriales bacterium]
MKRFDYTAICVWAITLTALTMLFGFSTSKDKIDTNAGGPWENMGTNVQQICDATYLLQYEWGVTFNNASPVLRVTCNSWNSGQRVCTYPPYATGDAEPFNFGGACWVWGTSSTLDNPCSVAYQFYYYQDTAGKMYMNSGNGCDVLPTVWRRKL